MVLARILEISKIACWLAATTLFCTMSYLCLDINSAIKKETANVTKIAETAAILANARLISMQDMVDRRTGDALRQIDTAIKLVDDSTKEISEVLTASKNELKILSVDVSGKLDGRLGEMTGEIKTLHAEISPLLRSATATLSQVENAAPLFLDCDHNPDCIFNRYVGVAKATENTMQDVSASVPRFLAIAGSVGENVEAGSRKYLEVAQDTHVFITRMTPPKFPTWLRWALGIAPPIAQTGASVVGIGAIMGQFR